MKWLAALSVVVVALLVLIWLQMREPAVAVAATEKPAPAPVVAVAQADQSFKEAVQKIEKVKAEEQATGKISTSSDEFQVKFDDVLPQAATRNAAPCYTGGLNRVHRNQKVKLKFRNHIKNGVVSITDVKVDDEETTIHDKALVDCFVREVAKTTWTDAELPDWDQDDELIIRPERGMKKFTKENMDYQGSGPDFTVRAPGT